MLQRTPHTNRRSRSRRGAAALVAAVALLGASCGGDADENGESDEPAAEPAETTAAPEGVEFTSADQSFEVVFPEEPSERTAQMPLPDGQTVEVPTQVASFSMSNFTTAIVEYPKNVPVSDDPDQALDDAVDDAVANVKGAELVNSDEVDLDGTPGRRVEVKVQQGNAFAQGQGLFLLDDQTMYQAIAVGPEQDADAHRNFVDSFKLL